MSDLISRNALIEKLNSIGVKIDYDALKQLVDEAKDEDVLETIIKYVLWQTSEIALRYVKNAPTIEAVPVWHGDWIAQDSSRTKFMCSVCSGKNYGGHENFCPKCGSKMDGVV